MPHNTYLCFESCKIFFKTTSINPASKYLATFLAEEEEKSTADVLPDEGKKVNNIQAPTKVGEDNDFSMDFD